MPVRPSDAADAVRRLDSLLTTTGPSRSLDEICSFLRERFAHYAWVGIYRLDGTMLVLAGWAGDRPTEHARIPVERGLCGQAVRERRTIRVGDVRGSEAYLACFRETRSELVVPVWAGDRIVGEIDIDGNSVDGFDESDETFIGGVAERISSRLSFAAAS